MQPILIAYQAAGTLAAILASPYLLWRGLRHPREMAERFGQARRTDAASADGRRPLWIHAASLGEVEAAAGLLEDPRRRLEAPVLLTVLSVSARRWAEERFPGVEVRFAPMDLWFAVGPFLRRYRPRGLVLLETELWPWTLRACRHARIPAALVSARLSARKWRRTRRARPLLLPAVRSLDAIGAQGASDAARFEALGAPGVRVTGNLKYRPDLVAAEVAGHAHAAADVPASVGARAKMEAGEPVPDPDGPDGEVWLVLGSLRVGEEAALEAGRRTTVRLVVVPRHLREREHWVAALGRLGIPAVLRSGTRFDLPRGPDLRVPSSRASLRATVRAALEEGSPALRAEAGGGGGTSPVRVPTALLVDVHGELGSWYAAADLAFVGGSLVPIGGHNLFEPAREGLPVAFGPHTAGVEDVAEILLRHGGGERVTSGAEFSAWASRLAENPTRREVTARAALAAAREAAESAERTWSLLERLPWVGLRGFDPRRHGGGRPAGSAGG